MRAHGLLALAVVLGALLLAVALAAFQPISALAPVQVVLDGQQELVGVAVAASGTVYVSDRGAGVVYRLEPPGYFTVALAGLDHPAGLALDGDGRLLIAEEKAGRVLRLESNGTLSVLATGIKKPRWLAVAPDGALYALYVSAHRLQSPERTDETEGREILRFLPDGSLSIVASGIRRLEGLARLGSAVVAATRGLESGLESAGMFLWYPVSADGSLGAPLTWVDTRLKQPVGLVLDWLGALYVSSKELAVGTGTAKRAIGKVHPDALLSAFAEHLEDPQGVALGPEGSLYVADGKAGRLLRFRAPRAPVVNALPAFTNQSPIPVAGTTEPNARLDLFVNDAPPAVTGTADVSGAFSIMVPLSLNAKNSLRVFATTHAGDGLTSAPARASLTHDNTPPDTEVTGGPGGTVSETTVTFTVAGSDNLTPPGNLQFAWRLDGRPFSSFTADTQFSLTGLTLGPHTFEVKARDLAGNEDPTPAQRTFTVAPLAVQITTPAGDAPLTPGPLLVRGTVKAGGAEVGVVVNGVLAAVQGTTFAALVAVSPETTTLTAHATTAAGATATHSVAITVAPTLEPAMALLPSPQSGVAPLIVAFSLLGGPVPTQVELDVEGNGIVDFTGPSLEGHTFTYPQPGLYVPRVILTDARGTRLSASTVVQVLDPTILEGLLQAKWQGMRDALRRGDTEGVLQTVAVGIRTRYRPALETLRGDLPALAATLGDLQVISFQDGLAEAATVRLEDGQRRVYFIYFVPDDDGIWRIGGM